MKKLSQCVTTEAQTENYRPCPAMQNLVRDLIPYIQRFIYYHDEVGEIYEDLKESGIAEEIKSLSFGQVSTSHLVYNLLDLIFAISDLAAAPAESLPAIASCPFSGGLKTESKERIVFPPTGWKAVHFLSSGTAR